MKFISIGGALNQYETSINEYLEATKDLYKDLICVAKDETTNEIRPMSMVFKVNSVTTSNGAGIPTEDEHPQNFLGYHNTNNPRLLQSVIRINNVVLTL